MDISIISRVRIGQSVMVGDELRVTVLGIKASKIRLGFTAQDLPLIHREDEYSRIQQIKREEAAAAAEKAARK